MYLQTQLRVVKAVFISNIKDILRYFTIKGYILVSLMAPIFLIATSWVVASMLMRSGGLDNFLKLTGYEDYIGFVILGYSFNGFLVATVFRGGEALYDEQRYGTLELVLITNASRFAFMLGKASAAMVNALIDMVIIISMGLMLFGIRFYIGVNLVIALSGFMLTIMALIGYSFFLAGIGMILKEPHAISVMMVPVLIFLSGFMFPVEALPFPIRLISYTFPLTYGLKIVRGSLLGGLGMAALWYDLLILIACIMVYTPLGYLTFKLLEKRAKNVGTLHKF